MHNLLGGDNMTINLYSISDDKHVVDKSLGTGIDVSGTARGAFNVTGGEITVESSANLSTYNYCYISETNRYYYINKITIERNNLYVLELSVDVLKTYSTGIKALRGTVDRQENLYNGYLSDSNYNAMCYTQIVAKEFPNEMSSDNLILMTVG